MRLTPFRIYLCWKSQGKEEDEDKNYATTHINKTMQPYFLEDNRLLEWDAV